MIVATTNDLAGYRIVRHIGVVRGITVRSRSVVGNFGGQIQAVFGGKLSIYVKLAETARQEARSTMPKPRVPTPSLLCVTTPTRSWTASQRCWPMARRWSSSRYRSVEIQTPFHDESRPRIAAKPAPVIP